MKNTDRWLVEEYGYLEGIVNTFLGLLPPPLRKIYYKVTFSKFGKNVFIG